MTKSTASLIDVSASTTAALVAFYNAHAAKPVSKFADRKTAERRVAALLAEIAARTPAPVAKSAKATAKVAKVAKAAAPAASATRSVAIAASWNDPTVAAARAERSHVVVKGVEYRSVLQAFQQLGLPVQKHIAFRGQLKAAGKLAFNGIVFQIVTPE